MKQKFSKFTLVKVTKDMPESMRHFECGFTGIVDGTYSQIYGGTDIESYSLYVLKDNKIVNKVSWYYEDQLSLYEYQNKEVAEQLVEDYNFKN